MAAYSYAHVTPAERFTYRISTGYSVHSDPVEATVGGIAEVVERDAIALLWLQRLRLPELRPDVRSSRLTTLIGWAERHFLRIHLYDATTDLGVPTVWVLVVSDHDDERRHVAGCATGRTLVAAAEKAAAEAIAVRGVLHSDDPIPDDFADYTTIRDGARFMGRAEQSDAFDFLRPGPDREAGRCPAAAALPADPDAALAALIGIFARRDMPVVVVDRTPGEVAAAGLVCVSVVIPDLQPMSLRPLAQFTAHPRLYDAPARMGYPVLSETELNPWPLPFA
jgi:ribosomal protein S12 methylthiotransferase accessory factor